ncbi:MAG: response regulator transcription factor [Rhodospirillales bacterium]|nr:response regulator transcription factor [Rhodospirillales bacterium]
MFNVLLADDHPLFRSALRHVIAGVFREYRIYEASTLDEARQVVGGETAFDLDMIMLDLQMPGSSGFSGLVTLRNAAPEVPIVVVSAATSPEIMRDAITYGAAGFIPKSYSKDQIGEGIARVLNGEVYLPLVALGSDGERPTQSERLRDRIAALTPGELRVFELLAQGKSNKIIAYELGIKESTVKAHITAILRKLRVHSRTQAVIAARELSDG